MSIQDNYSKIKQETPKEVQLVVVSKKQSIEKIKEVYDLGHRHFGENKVQELLSKKDELPSDIHWHIIGHLQTNKVKYIIPFVELIHSVDSLKLLKEIQNQAKKIDRKVNCLLQVKVAQEESKYGLNEEEITQVVEQINQNKFPNVQVKGIMGMATFTDNKEQIKQEFLELNSIYNKYKNELNFEFLSMGMSGDYLQAIECGSTMIRVGSSIFAE
ncbi:MAG: YggS family pyridoxal phosphate-dependent enzyme [Flavobacteriales bacterium]|nr:YggS family pyridoxal phosphate-dependent enzyme [Flavobacteriales bacterium]